MPGLLQRMGTVTVVAMNITGWMAHWVDRGSSSANIWDTVKQKEEDKEADH